MLKQRGSLLANKTFYYMPVFSTRHQVESQIEYELDKNDVLVAIDEIPSELKTRMKILTKFGIVYINVFYVIHGEMRVLG